MVIQNCNVVIFRQKLSIILPCASLSIAIFLSYVMKVSWNLKDCMNVLLIASLPLCLGFTLLRQRTVPAFAGFLAISGLIIMLSMIQAALALLGTRSPVPVADFWLAAADNLLPLSAIDIVILSNQLPEWAIRLLQQAYKQTALCLYLSLLILLLMDRQPMAWRQFLIWGGCFLLVSLLAFAAPALGVYSQLTAEQVDHLPKGAGRFGMQPFTEFRNASEPELSLGNIGSVTTFPSFHTVCALVVAQGWHGIRVIGPLAKLLASVIIISCVPIGGHYVIDLAAGAAVWWGVTLGIDRLESRQAAKRQTRSIAIAPA